jgi:cyclase
MDAKRIVPVLQVSGGQVWGPEGPVPPSTWASRLELEGADGILFREADGEPAGRRSEWIREVAGSLSIPFALEAPLRNWAELEEILEAGADKVVMAAALEAEDPLLVAAAGRFGRTHVAVAVNAVLTGSRWQLEGDGPEGPDALARMADLERWGAGEILLRTAPQASCAALCQDAAGLALSVLWLCRGGEAEAADALLHGADGLAFPDLTRSSRQWKQILALHGLPFRE